jgi:hypothetical protein
MKICSKCGVEKDESEFHKSSYSCKKCESQRKKSKRLMNRESLLKKEAEWRKNNKRYISEISKRYYLKNKKNVNESNKLWRLNNTNIHNALRKKWKIENSDKIKNQSRKSINNLYSGYIRTKLKRSGLSKEAIEQYPILIDLKRVEIKTKRKLKKQII